MRLIDADALLANRQILRGGDAIGIRDYVTVAEIENAPTIEPERETGRWIDHSDEGYVECPFCGHATNCEDNIDELHYCFYCGAKMEVGG